MVFIPVSSVSVTADALKMACNILGGLMAYCSYKDSPLYVCSLDAEKCFDSIWHDGLFYKLLPVLKQSHWLFLYAWYKSMKCVVRWNGDISDSLNVERGTRQGSILSPTLFNIFIDDLLKELIASNVGVRIGKDLYNSFAYADDVTLCAQQRPICKH